MIETFVCICRADSYECLDLNRAGRVPISRVPYEHEQNPQQPPGLKRFDPQEETYDHQSP